ncbi:MAG: hypothetical protein Q9174_006944 [Haloplaca sp. 1 TL-2023]
MDSIGRWIIVKRLVSKMVRRIHPTLATTPATSAKMERTLFHLGSLMPVSDSGDDAANDEKGFQTVGADIGDEAIRCRLSDV